MKLKKNTLLLIGLGIVIFLAISILLNMYLSQKPIHIYKVVKTADGYTPTEITIHQGDTIVFSNTEKDYYWPASDPHPIHTIYPAFDPKVPINPKKTWQFRFDRVGTWMYHDHLAPYFTGTVTVL